MSVSTIIAKGRDKNFDWIKGIAIIFVVIGHIIQFNDSQSMYSSIFNWISSFHMPVFFIISGYFFTLSLTKVKSFGQTVKKRFQSLFVPYIVWTFFVPVLLLNSSLEFNFRLLYDSDGRYWYIQTLFYISMIHLLSNTISTRVSKNFNVGVLLDSIFVLFILTVMNYFLPCNVTERGFHYSPLYLMGVTSLKYNLFKRITKTDLSVVVIMFILSSLCYKWYMVGYWGIPMKIFKYPAGVSALIILWKCANIQNYANKVNQFIIYCGENSIVIYLTHFAFILVFTKILSYCNELTPVWIFFVAFVFSVPVIILCLTIGKIIESFPLLNKLLYGKHAIK